MKYAQDSICNRSDLGSSLKKIVSDLLAGNLIVEGQRVDIPEDLDLDTKVKYGIDDAGGNVTIKVSWDNFIESADGEEIF